MYQKLNGKPEEINRLNNAKLIFVKQVDIYSRKLITRTEIQL
jgi:hypothetical protein